jgi:DNA-binding MarR family transcriptional regulator
METQTPTATGSIVLLTRLARLVYRRSTVDLVGMSLKDLAVLAYLRDSDGGMAAQQALAEALCIDANNCVLVLNELEEEGFIERRRDPADRRRHLVELTTGGRHALESAEQAQGSVEDDLLGALSPKEREELQRLLCRALEGQGQGPHPQD